MKKVRRDGKATTGLLFYAGHSRGGGREGVGGTGRRRGRAQATSPTNKQTRHTDKCISSSNSNTPKTSPHKSLFIEQVRKVGFSSLFLSPPPTPHTHTSPDQTLLSTQNNDKGDGTAWRRMSELWEGGGRGGGRKEMREEMLEGGREKVGGK